MPYDDSNRAFLQAFLSKRVLTFAEARPVLAAIFTAQRNDDTEVRPETVTEQIFSEYVSDANDAISRFDLEIRSMLNQKDRSRIYALVNTTSDDLTQLATSHTADEIAFFKRVMDAMFYNNNTPDKEIMAIQGSQALRLHKNPPGASQHQDGNNNNTQSTTGLSIAGAEAALKSFQEEGWLEKSKMGYFTLSPRALLELKVYLTQTYNEPDDPEDPDSPVVERIKSCHGCKEIITVGQRCTNIECAIRFHDPCAVIKFGSGGGSGRGNIQSQRGGLTGKCPSCGSEWTGREYVGEKADNGRRRISGASTGGPSRSRGAVAAAVGESLGRLTRTAVTNGSNSQWPPRRQQQHQAMEEEEEDGEEGEQ